MPRIRDFRGISGRAFDGRGNYTVGLKDQLVFLEINYAKVDNQQYRLIKAATPGAYTFILEATKEVPRRLSHPSRKTIGLRVPEHKVLQALLDLHNGPLLATTLIPPGETEPINDALEIRERYKKQIAAVIDAGACPREPTTVVDLTESEPVVIRQGRGSLAALGL